MNLSKSILNFLIVCFWANILVFSFAPILAFLLFTNRLERTDSLFYSLQIIGSSFAILAIILLGYCIYFNYKFDKYSGRNSKLWLLGVYYTPFYFYNIIWKQKRPLVNSFKEEPVLGNTILLMEEEDEN